MSKELNLLEEINKAMQELIKGDVIKNIITKQLEQTVTEIVKNSMRSYSDFGKIISEKINQVVNLAANNFLNTQSLFLT